MMKAACVLLCLALGASANILKHQQPTDELNLDDWQQFNQQNQRQWNQEQHHQNEKDQTRKSFSEESQRQHVQSQHHHSQQQYSSHISQEQDGSKPQTMGQQTPHNHHHTLHEHSDSASSESVQDSWELRTKDHKDSSKQQHDVRSHRHSITWRGLEIPVGHHSIVRNEEDIEKVFGDAQEAMKHITEEEKQMLNQVYERAQDRVSEDVDMNFTQLVQKHQYPVEEHTIKTVDGYILTVYRIPAKDQIHDAKHKRVVFLMHDILGSADDWVLMGPGKSLAYLLSEEGYDVWLGNARGNKYSQRHVTKHPAVSDFWQFSIDEIALHDLPAMIDYVLKTTNQVKLHYVGHGQGTTALFALTATHPEYNGKVIMMYAMAPMVHFSHVRSPLLRMITPTSKFQEELQKQIGNGAFTPSKELIENIGGALLEKEIGNKKVSLNVNFVLSGINVEDIDSDLVPVMMGHLPAGTSAKVIKHYGQIVASNEFRRYDHGPQTNEKVYGQKEAPRYEIEKVTVPIAMFFSEEDWLAHPDDVETLQKELSNVQESYRLPEQHFSHMDFQFSPKAHNVVYKQLIVSMNYQQYNFTYM